MSTIEKIGYFFANYRVIDGVKYICTSTILSLCSHISSSVFKNSFRILQNSSVLNGTSITILVILDNSLLHYSTQCYGMHVYDSIGPYIGSAIRLRTTYSKACNIFLRRCRLNCILSIPKYIIYLFTMHYNSFKDYCAILKWTTTSRKILNGLKLTSFM